MKFFRLMFVEMRRAMHRRLVRWMIVIALALCVLAGFVVFATSSDPVKFAADGGHPARMINWWMPLGQGDSYLLTASLLLVVGAAICGASFAGAEWRAGTITTVLTWEPSRLRLHAARTAAAAILSFVIGLAIQIVFLGAAVPAVVAHGTVDGTTRSWWFSLLLAMLRISLITSAVAVLAVSIATIGRNTSAALIALAAWALVVERLVAGFWPKLARFMISENAATVVPWAQLGNVKFERPPIVALLSLIAYLAAIVAASTALFIRRDVTTT